MLNKVLLIGNLGKDPESRYTQNGNPVTNFSIATSEKWTDKQGVKQEKTEWHNITAFGRQAEVCRDFLNKGSKVYLEGKLQTDKWQDKNGQDRWTTKVILRTVVFLSKQEKQSDYTQQSQSSHYDDNDIPF